MLATATQASKSRPNSKTKRSSAQFVFHKLPLLIGNTIYSSKRLLRYALRTNTHTYTQAQTTARLHGSAHLGISLVAIKVPRPNHSIIAH